MAYLRLFPRLLRKVDKQIRETTAACLCQIIWWHLGVFVFVVGLGGWILPKWWVAWYALPPSKVLESHHNRDWSEDPRLNCDECGIYIYMAFNFRPVHLDDLTSTSCFPTLFPTKISSESSNMELKFPQHGTSSSQHGAQGMFWRCCGKCRRTRAESSWVLVILVSYWDRLLNEPDFGLGISPRAEHVVVVMSYGNSRKPRSRAGPVAATSSENSNDEKTHDKDRQLLITKNATILQCIVCKKSISIKHWRINLMSFTWLFFLIILHCCSLRWIGNPAVRLVRRHVLYIAACVERNPRHEIKLEKKLALRPWFFCFKIKPPSHLPNGPVHARSSKWQWHWPGLGGLCKAHFWWSQGLVSSAPSLVCRVGWKPNMLRPLHLRHLAQIQSIHVGKCHYQSLPSRPSHLFLP